MVNILNEVVDDFSKSLFGMTIQEALDKEVCIICKWYAYDNIYSVAGVKEYIKSGLCEDCFDEMFDDEG